MSTVDYPECLRELLESRGDTSGSLDVVAELSNPLPFPGISA